MTALQEYVVNALKWLKANPKKEELGVLIFILINVVCTPIVGANRWSETFAWLFAALYWVRYFRLKFK